MHDIEVAPILPENRPKGARDWTRCDLHLRPNERLGSALAFDWDGEDWWTDGGGAFLGTCPAAYRKQLIEAGRWIEDEEQAAPMGGHVVKTILRELEPNGDPRRYVPAFTTSEPSRTGRGELVKDWMVPKGAENLIAHKRFNARYIGLALRRYRGVFFTLSKSGDALVVREETGKLVGFIMRMETENETKARQARRARAA